MKKIAIRLMGGLGNQMFEYAALRTMALENKAQGYIDLCGITNKTHNVYSLNHFNISNDIIVTRDYKSFKKTICHILLGIYYHIYSKFTNGFKKFNKYQSKMNIFGLYCVPDGYVKLQESHVKSNYMEGYYQSYKYFEKYKDIIVKELTVSSSVSKKNHDLYNSIVNSNSVCVHIRRGDYIGGDFQVCNSQYYYDAIRFMNKKVNTPIYFIFSDDIEWVKNNMKFGKNKVVYVDKKNKNYEELQLMYSCKHFIMSNSTFSYWAQFLSNNSKKVVVAPSKWFASNKVSDIYEEGWNLINIKD